MGINDRVIGGRMMKRKTNRMPFGKYRGRRVEKLPDDYVAWVRITVGLEGWLRAEFVKHHGGEFKSSKPTMVRGIDVLRQVMAEIDAAHQKRKAAESGK